MKYSLRSLMIVGLVLPPLLALGWFEPVVAAVSVILFLPLFLRARFRLWGLFSALACGWALIYLNDIPELERPLGTLRITLGLAWPVVFCLPFYGVIPIYNAWHRGREAAAPAPNPPQL